MSRFITYPSTVSKEAHTVVMIDVSEEDRKRLELYLQVCFADFDVYLYEGNTGDLEWLNHINTNVDATLINNSSQVKVSSAIRYGDDCEIVDPLAYFEQFNVDNNVENVV